MADAKTWVFVHDEDLWKAAGEKKDLPHGTLKGARRCFNLLHPSGGLHVGLMYDPAAQCEGLLVQVDAGEFATIKKAAIPGTKWVESGHEGYGQLALFDEKRTELTPFSILLIDVAVQGTYVQGTLEQLALFATRAGKREVVFDHENFLSWQRITDGDVQKMIEALGESGGTAASPRGKWYREAAEQFRTLLESCEEVKLRHNIELGEKTLTEWFKDIPDLTRPLTIEEWNNIFNTHSGTWNSIITVNANLKDIADWLRVQGVNASMRPMLEAMRNAQAGDIVGMVTNALRFKDLTEKTPGPLLDGASHYDHIEEKKWLIEREDFMKEFAGIINGMRRSFSENNRVEFNNGIERLWNFFTQRYFHYSKEGLGFLLDSVSLAFSQLGFLSANGDGAGTIGLTDRGAEQLKRTMAPPPSPDGAGANEKAKKKILPGLYVYEWWAFKDEAEYERIKNIQKHPRARGTDRIDVREVGRKGKDADELFHAEKTDGLVGGRYLGKRGMIGRAEPWRDIIGPPPPSLRHGEIIALGVARLTIFKLFKANPNMLHWAKKDPSKYFSARFLEEQAMRANQEEYGPWHWAMWEWKDPRHVPTGEGVIEGRVIAWQDGEAGLLPMLEALRPKDQPPVDYATFIDSSKWPEWLKAVRDSGKMMELLRRPGIGVEGAKVAVLVNGEGVELRKQNPGDGVFLIAEVPLDRPVEVAAGKEGYYGIAPGRMGVNVGAARLIGGSLNPLTGLPVRLLLFDEHKKATVVIVLQKGGEAPTPEQQDKNLLEIFDNIKKDVKVLDEDPEAEMKWFEKYTEKAVLDILHQLLALRQNYPRAFLDARADSYFKESITILFNLAKSYKNARGEFRPESERDWKFPEDSKIPKGAQDVKPSNIVQYISQIDSKLGTRYDQQLRGLRHRDVIERVKQIEELVRRAQQESPG